MSGWSKREQVRGEFVKLGDKDGQVQEVQGVLIAIKESTRYEGQLHYYIKDHEGDVLIVPGARVIDDQIGVGDVGKLIRLAFLGWGVSKRGASYKDFEIAIWNGPISEEMRNSYPDLGVVHQHEIQAAPKPQDTTITKMGEPTGAGPSKFPAKVHVDEDDDLPF